MFWISYPHIKELMVLSIFHHLWDPFIMGIFSYPIYNTKIQRTFYIVKSFFFNKGESSFMLSVLLNLLQRSILFIHSVCSAFLSPGNNIFAVRTGFELVWCYLRGFGLICLPYHKWSATPYSMRLPKSLIDPVMDSNHI